MPGEAPTFTQLDANTLVVPSLAALGEARAAARRAGCRTLVARAGEGDVERWTAEGFALAPRVPPGFAVGSGEVVVRLELEGVVTLHPYDRRWPSLFEAERDRIVGALGPLAAQVEHVGSTSVPGLSAKPIIDIVLAVPDSAAEPTYRPLLEAVHYEFRLREPEWFEHRLFVRHWPRVNLHVFGSGCPEPARMVAFRDHLRAHPDDRDRYEAVKRDLAGREWATVQDYADAKTGIVREIQARAAARRGEPTQ